MNDKRKDRPAGGRGKSFDDRPRKPFAKDAGSDAEPSGQERIAKRLARAGVASRREAESLIAAGRIKVNGRVLDTPALNVGESDKIEIDGNPIPAIERTRLFLFHKPAGVVTTNRDPEGRKTVFDVLPDGLPRLVTVGRLDINTEGLLLLTNDGGLARQLELPSTGWLRRYRVRVHGEVDEAALAGLREGIAVDGIFYSAVEAALDRRQGTNAWLTLGLREGKNREVKNILAALGLDVTRLIRVSYGPFQLGELPEGHIHELKGKGLREQLGERMIAEAGANFEAPIVTPFSNKRDAAAPSPASAEPRKPRLQEPGEGGLIKNRRKQREDHREKVLGKLSTRAPGARPSKKREEREEKPFQAPRSRSANVWMAPGARPVSPRQKEQRDEDDRATERPRKPRLNDPNARVGKRRQDNEETRPRRSDADRHGGDARRNDRPERPRAERSHRDDTRGERPRFAKPDGENAERPRAGRPGSQKPAFAKPRSDRPQSDRTRSDRPRSEGQRSGDRDGKPGRAPGQHYGKPGAGRPAGAAFKDRKERPNSRPDGERTTGSGKPYGPKGGGKPQGDRGPRGGDRPSSGKGKPGADRRR